MSKRKPQQGTTAVHEASRSGSTPARTNDDYINHTAIMAYRTETILREHAARQYWTEKFEPWFADQYRQMYASMAKVHGISRENSVIPMQRAEWQQSTDALPPVHQRPCGQRRRRVAGAFPQTANDAIGWRVLPQHALEIYGSTSAASHAQPVRKQWKFSSWPLESLH